MEFSNVNESKEIVKLESNEWIQSFQNTIEVYKKIEQVSAQYQTNWNLGFKDQALEKDYTNLAWHLLLDKKILDFIVLISYEIWTIFVLIRILISMKADFEYLLLFIITKSLHVLGIFLYFFTCKSVSFSKFVTCFVIVTYSLELLPILDSSGDSCGKEVDMYINLIYGIIHGAGLMTLIYKFKNHFVYAIASYCFGVIVLIIFFIKNEINEQDELDTINFTLGLTAFFLLGIIFTYYYSVNEQNLRKVFLSIVYTKNFVNEICKFLGILPINIIESNGIQLQYANN